MIQTLIFILQTRITLTHNGADSPDTFNFILFLKILFFVPFVLICYLTHFSWTSTCSLVKDKTTFG